MNLKEAFRYQNFLGGLMVTARGSILSKEHCLKITKKHLKSKANADAVDVEETVACDEEFFHNDDVIRFMQWLVEEREKLTTAIGDAKASVSFDIDAAIETNKFRQSVNAAIAAMLRNKPYKRTESGRDYKFNVEGNQSPYIYDVEVTAAEAFDREESRRVMRSLAEEADKVSAAIDAAMINTTVSFTPVYDVNDTFEDVMRAFVNAG